MAALEKNIALAQSLHPRLLAFFTKFPPPQIASLTPSATTTISTAENTSSSDPNVGATITATPLADPQQPTATSSLLNDAYYTRNPFLPFKNPATGHWQAPHYSLRRQAELYKLAIEHHVLSLMPPSPKHPELRLQKRVEHGLRVQGTGVGKQVKGKSWERSLQGRLNERRKAMENMPAMIRDWKQRGHGRGWKKWPK